MLDLKHNMLLVSKILNDTTLVAYFTLNRSLLHNLTFKRHIRDGHQDNGLYGIDMLISKGCHIMSLFFIFIALRP